MTVSDLLDALSCPEVYPAGVRRVEVIQTHISLVFLCEEVVYKIRKPVRLGFLDFSTLAKRRHDCEEEVRLNRRLAPGVYLGVVPVTRTSEGLRVEGEGEAVEWAVKMKRLPAGVTALDRLQRGELTEAPVVHLARVIAAFHHAAASGPAVSEYGRFSVVARNARENFEQTEAHVGTTVRRAVFDRVRSRCEAALTELAPLIEARAERGVPRDTHGDLHLDHIYLFPDRPPPDDVVVIDCVEFNERFRFADPVADMGFLAMDLRFQGRRDLAIRFADAYFEASGDAEGARLLPFYTAYRSLVRAKVEGFAVGESEIAEAQREKLKRSAQAHWLLALGELETPSRRPALLLVAGLPGTGKSTLARECRTDGFEVIRTDEVRKDLFGQETEKSERGLYSPEKTRAVYAECLRRSRESLLDGKRVLVDANFREEAAREPFRELANQLAVPILLAICEASPETVRARLARREGDASDADWEVYRRAASRWEEPGEVWKRHLIRVATDGGTDRATERVRSRLREGGESVISER